jgi:hypothetical protein
MAMDWYAATVPSHRRKIRLKQCQILLSKKIDLKRDFAAVVYLPEAPSPPRLLYGVV